MEDITVLKGHTTKLFGNNTNNGIATLETKSRETKRILKDRKPCPICGHSEENHYNTLEGGHDHCRCRVCPKEDNLCF
jgi:hypothetical protein